MHTDGDAMGMAACRGAKPAPACMRMTLMGVDTAHSAVGGAAAGAGRLHGDSTLASECLVNSTSCMNAAVHDGPTQRRRLIDTQVLPAGTQRPCAASQSDLLLSRQGLTTDLSSR